MFSLMKRNVKSQAPTARIVTLSIPATAQNLSFRHLLSHISVAPNEGFIPLVAFGTLKLSLPMAVPCMLCTDVCCTAISESQSVPGLNNKDDVSLFAILQYIC
jgi:hypothetical protein